MLTGIGMGNLSWSCSKEEEVGFLPLQGEKGASLGHTNSIANEHSEGKGGNTIRLLHITDPKYGLKFLIIFDKMLLRIKSMNKSS